MLLPTDIKNIGIVRYSIFLIFFENQAYPNTNHFDTTCKAFTLTKSLSSNKNMFIILFFVHGTAVIDNL